MKKNFIIILLTMLALGFLFMLTLQQASGDQSDSTGGDQSDSSSAPPVVEYFSVIINYVADDDITYTNLYTGDIAVYDSENEGETPLAVIEYGETESVIIYSGYLYITAYGEDAEETFAGTNDIVFSGGISYSAGGDYPWAVSLIVTGDGEILSFGIEQTPPAPPLTMCNVSVTAYNVTADGGTYYYSSTYPAYNWTTISTFEGSTADPDTIQVPQGYYLRIQYDNDSIDSIITENTYSSNITCVYEYNTESYVTDCYAVYLINGDGTISITISD